MLRKPQRGAAQSVSHRWVRLIGSPRFGGPPFDGPALMCAWATTDVVHPCARDCAAPRLPSTLRAGTCALPWARSRSTPVWCGAVSPAECGACPSSCLSFPLCMRGRATTGLHASEGARAPGSASRAGATRVPRSLWAGAAVGGQAHCVSELGPLFHMVRNGRLYILEIRLRESPVSCTNDAPNSRRRQLGLVH